MKRKKKLALILIVVILLVVNLPPINTLIITLERDSGFYSYSRKDDTSSIYFENGMGPARYVYFQIRDRDLANGIIRKDTMYRNFRINPFFFWHWKEYIFDERYKLPYISRDSVIRNARNKGMNSKLGTY